MLTSIKKRKQGAEQVHRIAKTKQDRKFILTPESGFYIQEAYKALRTNVSFALANTEGCKVVMVTSALQSEGKSMTALNLAIALGQMDKKVLLIDCDLRRPKLARLLNMSAPAGLSNLLMDFGLLNGALIKSEEYGIDLILAGDIPPNPAELLSSNRMQKFLSALREHYDYIIIDSPPVDLVVDAVALSAQCDGVLFVVRAGQSERGAVIHAMQQLSYGKANVIGFVFNGVTPETTSGYGKYRYKKYGKYHRYSRYSRYGHHYGYQYGYGYVYGQHGVPKETSNQEKQPENV